MTGTETFYLLVCRECDNGDLVMPFRSAAERGKWAAEHTRGTGHDRWSVRDETLPLPSERPGPGHEQDIEQQGDEGAQHGTGRSQEG